MQGLLIESVLPGSPAERAGITAGQRLTAINGEPIKDLIDYSYLASEDELELELLDQDGRTLLVELDADYGEAPGLSFAPPEPKRCGNNCIFCFVHQLPKGLRKPLYVKDEDYRLSFLHGTYVTLTNLKPSELKRIVELRLSPLYISVHATDSLLREKLLGKSGIPPIIDQMKTLAAARIEMHTQVVLCPGINDGAALEKTVADLASLHPAVSSLAIVPVGLTSHREKLPLLKPVDQSYARDFLEHWQPSMQKLNKQLGTSFLQLADEFFLKAGRPFPPLKQYGDLPQWENGVGMVPLFLKEATSTIKQAKTLTPVTATLITGHSAAGFVSEFINSLNEKTGCSLKVVPIENNLFGKSVTVTGLIGGNDIIASLSGVKPGELLFLPSVMLKEGEGLFLDDLSPKDLENQLGVKVLIFDGTPSGLYQLLRKTANRKGR